MTSNQRTFPRRLAAAAAVLGLLAAAPEPARAAAAPVEAAQMPVRAADAPLRIMPLGDSITWGVGSAKRNGYRAALYRRLTDAGLNVDFVGSMSTGTGPDPDNEGHKGWTIAQLAAGVDGWLAAYEPDVILLHIGTNDMTRAIPGAPQQLSDLLDRISADAPEADVFVAKIVGLADSPGVGGQRSRTDAYNAALERIVARKGDRFHLVDQSGIHGIDMFNRVHPNDYGYAQMAWNWYRALEPVLDSSGEPWPRTADPYRAAVSYRCLDDSELDPAAHGCHVWYHRTAPGAVTSRVWQLPVRTRVKYRVKIDGKIVTRTKIVTRWVIAR
jgi:lysophospholipase L1-like esterase